MTIENQKEADDVVENIINTNINFPYIDSQDGQCVGGGYMTYKSALKLAVINRQSVLDALDSLNEDFIIMKIRRNITEQINYLKSKL